MMYFPENRNLKFTLNRRNNPAYDAFAFRPEAEFLFEPVNGFVDAPFEFQNNSKTTPSGLGRMIIMTLPIVVIGIVVYYFLKKFQTRKR